MAWETIEAGAVQVGDQLRYRTGEEFTVARIDGALLGRPGLLCLIEDSPDRWHAYPAPATSSIERKTAD